MYKTIVFDVDGTLINTETAIIKGLKEVLESSYKQTYTDEELAFALGIPSHSTIKKLDISDGDTFEKMWQQAVHDYNHLTHPYPGIVALLKALKSLDINLGIVTSRKVIECKNDPIYKSLKNYFDVVIQADHTEKHKPFPEPLLQFLKQSGARAEETLYIGDTLYDSSCAKGSQVDFLLAGWGAKSQDIPCIDILSHPYDLLKYATR